MNRLLLLCLLLPLQACTPLTIRDADTNAYVPMQAGSLELHREVQFPRERTRVFFQDGAPVPVINEFKPHCQLEIGPLRDEVQRVQPDHFEVTRIATRIDPVVMTQPVRLAALGMGIGASFGGMDGGVTRQTQVFLFRLHSERQPQVRQLNCGGAFEDPGLAQWPTLQDIARSLGDHATLRLE